jgi:hypothetical protein
MLGELVNPPLLNKIRSISTSIIESQTADEIETQLGNNKTHVEHIFLLFTSHIFKTSSEESAELVIDDLSLSVKSNPRGDVPLSILWYAKQLFYGKTDEFNQAISKTSPPPEKAIENLVNSAIIESTSMPNGVMILSQTADNIIHGTLSQL